MKIVRTATLATCLVLAGSMPTLAGGGCKYNCNNGPNWGTVVGAGMLGATLGAIAGSEASAPPSQVIVITPAAPPSQPVVIQQQPLTAPWCPRYQAYFPAVRSCPGGFVPVTVPAATVPIASTAPTAAPPRSPTPGPAIGLPDHLPGEPTGYQTTTVHPN
jgi:hypothetical protein